jgi:putative transposase
LFARVAENGGYFVSRIKRNIDPVVVSIEEGVPKKKRDGFIGKTVNECIDQLPGKDADAIVKIDFKRRSYMESRDRMR